MENMEYAKGLGLEKDGQDRLEPVETSKQEGQRGLGHNNDELREAHLRSNPDGEEVSVREVITWLENSQRPPVAKDLEGWMGTGESKGTLDGETLFCDPVTVMKVLNSKSRFDSLDKDEMRRARTRSNPYEGIIGAFFLNDAAHKMANIDRQCHSMFTEPKTLGSGELLYFADVCAGPGGFSEYVMWRKKWHAKGFGLTLKETKEYKNEDFFAGPLETFHSYCGPKDNGDVCDPVNQAAFKRLIMQQTRGKGVHFMMADNGFSVKGKESIQEIHSKQLYLCQCLVALMIVRKGGHFVMKMFDLFTPFSAGLVYLMYRCFERVSIFKPNSSSLANSERYLICQGKRENVTDVIHYLAGANRVLLQRDQSRDIVDLVPHDFLVKDMAFFEYLKTSNDNFGEVQAFELLAAVCYPDRTLFEHRQAEMRKECLEYWSLPDQARTVPTNMRPEERLKSLVTNSSLKFLSSTATESTTPNVEKMLQDTPYDWFFMPCGSSGQIIDQESAATLYMGVGRGKTFRYYKGSWVPVPNLELLPDSLVYAEMISELRGEYGKQRKTTALHILDSYFLGGEDVSHKYLQDRYELTKMFCEALWKPINDKALIRVRAKELHALTNNLDDKVRLKPRIMEKGTTSLVHVPSSSTTSYDFERDDPYFFVPNSALFLNGTAQNWSRHISRSSGRTYFLNSADNRRFFDRDQPAEANAAFWESFKNRRLWRWPSDPALLSETLVRLTRNNCATPKTERQSVSGTKRTSLSQSNSLIADAGRKKRKISL